MKNKETRSKTWQNPKKVRDFPPNQATVMAQGFRSECICLRRTE